MKKKTLNLFCVLSVSPFNGDQRLRDCETFILHIERLNYCCTLLNMHNM